MTEDLPPTDADDWLLAADSVTAAEYKARGHEPAHPGLIRLTDREGVVRLPLFQFEPSGQPRPIVVEINQLLEVDQDPWGTADWWLGSNVWLDGSPASLLGTTPDEVLLSTARAEIPEQ
ncbi:hypothetical protein ACIQ9Q_29430 [Streptomyces sp. NPDC094438]|jgi:hypothetical protein|uniref:hypothetical protein n=1 Tax=Streptomyces sp. NPDC094438 TaxID=3366061 RepID=UPI0038188404